MTYFVVGAVMWGAGIIDWSQIGLVEMIMADPGGDVNPGVQQDLESAGGPIQNAAQSVGGPVLAVFQLIVGIIGYMFWPITVLASQGAPAEAILLLGGVPTVAFWMGVIRMLRESA